MYIMYIVVGAVHEVWWIPRPDHRGWDQHLHEPVAGKHQEERHPDCAEWEQPRPVRQYNTSTTINTHQYTTPGLLPSLIGWEPVSRSRSRRLRLQEQAGSRRTPRMRPKRRPRSCDPSQPITALPRFAPGSESKQYWARRRPRSWPFFSKSEMFQMCHK